MTTEILLLFFYFKFFHAQYHSRSTPVGTQASILETLEAGKIQFIVVSPTTMPRAVKYTSGRIRKFPLKDVTINEVI